MASSSRSFTIDWDSTEIADVQSKSFNLENSLVDVTTDDDNGWATFLAEPGRQSMTIEVSGIAENEAVLADAIVASTTDQTAIINLPSTQTTPGNITGTFIVTSFSYSGAAPDGSVEFTLSAQSSGSQAYTAST